MKYVIGILLSLTVGCKQGAGQRCQVNSDCPSGLVCNQGTVPPTCQGVAGDQIDANIIDAVPDSPAPADARVGDAPAHD